MAIQRVRLNSKEKAFTLERSKYTYSILQNMGIIKHGYEKDILDLEQSFYRLYKCTLNESRNGSIDLLTDGSIYYTQKLKEVIQKIGKITNCSTDIQLHYTKTFVRITIILMSNETGIGGIGKLPLQINKVDYDACQV